MATRKQRAGLLHACPLARIEVVDWIGLVVARRWAGLAHRPAVPAFGACARSVRALGAHQPAGHADDVASAVEAGR